jgi:hypothetical protein
MPRTKVKALEEVDPLIANAFRNAFAKPGQRIVVAPDVTPAVATNLQVRMQAVRQGFTKFYPRDHEYYRAAECGRLRIEREYDSKQPGLRTVTIRYTGLIKRPSEIAAEYMERLKNNPQVHPIRD